MLQFSTDWVPLSDRFEAWQWNAQKICGDCRFRFPRISSFHGSIRARTIGHLQLTRFSSSALSFRKNPLDLPLFENISYVVITQLRGTQAYSQGDAMTVLQPRDTTIINSAIPWSSDSPEDCARLYVRVPAWLMQDRLKSRHLPTGRRIQGHVGLGSALFGLATSLYEQTLGEPGDQPTSELEAFFHILAACLGLHLSDSTCPSRNLPIRIESFINSHLSDPALGPAGIAADAHISTRHLHRLFAKNGRTVSDCIRERRLLACRRDLIDPRLDGQSITEIAFSWGFCDSAHFSHSFRRRFGVSPREFRSLRRPDVE